MLRSSRAPLYEFCTTLVQARNFSGGHVLVPAREENPIPGRDSTVVTPGSLVEVSE